MFSATCLPSLIDFVEVDDDQIRIKESKDVLEHAILTQRHPDSGVRRLAQTGAQGRRLLDNLTY
jgi:hypothetical protein